MMTTKFFESGSMQLDVLLRRLNQGLRVGSLLAIATLSQCNYTPTSNSSEVTCCVPVENIEDCPCIVIVDVGEG